MKQPEFYIMIKIATCFEISERNHSCSKQNPHIKGPTIPQFSSPNVYTHTLWFLFLRLKGQTLKRGDFSSTRRGEGKWCTIFTDVPGKMVWEPDQRTIILTLITEMIPISLGFKAQKVFLSPHLQFLQSLHLCLPPCLHLCLSTHLYLKGPRASLSVPTIFTTYNPGITAPGGS